MNKERQEHAAPRAVVLRASANVCFKAKISFQHCSAFVMRDDGEGVLGLGFQDSWRQGVDFPLDPWNMFSSFAAPSKYYYFPHEYEIIVQNKKGIEWGGQYLTRVVLILEIYPLRIMHRDSADWNYISPGGIPVGSRKYLLFKTTSYFHFVSCKFSTQDILIKIFA